MTTRTIHTGNPWLVLIAMTGSLSMIMLDQTVVAVALPSMSSELPLSPVGQQWVVNAYVLGVQVDARRSGTYWPIQLQSDTLLDRMRQQTTPEHFSELWTDGERLTFRDVARSRGLTQTAR